MIASVLMSSWVAVVDDADEEGSGGAMAQPDDEDEEASEIDDIAEEYALLQAAEVLTFDGIGKTCALFDERMCMMFGLY